VRTLGTVASAQELGAVQLTLSDGRRVRLDQVADVLDTVAERRSQALLNGQPVVGFEITRARGASEIDVDTGVRRALDQLRAEHPDLRIAQAFNFVDPVAENYEGSMHLLYEGALLAVIVVWFFLRDWRATFVAATALPLSVIPAFLGMYLLGFSINVVTLLSLSLVVGILVDDAIVEIENIVRHLKMGKSPYQAAMEAADEIGLAVIATTFTLIAVFLPTAFMSGIPGKFFKQFGWTASLAVFASLVVARMLTPMMAAYLLKPIVHARPEGRVMRWYMRFAAKCLKHRWLTAAGAGLFFVGSIMLIPLLPTGFIPADDFGQTQVRLELPPGSTFEETRAAAEQARELLQKNQHVKLVYTAIGGGATGSDPFMPGGAAEVRKASLILNLTPRPERPGLRKQAIEAELRDALDALPGVRVSVGLGGSGEKYMLVLSGEDGQALLQAAQAVERDLRTIPGLGSVRSTASLVRPELVVRPDFARAAEAGVSSMVIADTLRIATTGDYDAALPKLNLSQRQVPIVVRLPESAREDLSLLSQLSVPGDQPLRPAAQRQLRGGAQRHAAGRRGGPGAEAAEPAAPAARREPGGAGRRGGDGRALRQLRAGDAHRRDVHLRGAGAAVQELHAAGDDPGGAAAVAGRGLRGAAADEERVLDALADRADHAHGHRHQELDPAGGLRDPGAARGHEPLGRAAGCVSQARAADRDDDHRHGRGHVADRDGAGHRPELPLADGGGGDRRADHQHLPEPAGDPGGVHLRGRRGGVHAAAPAPRAAPPPRAGEQGGGRGVRRAFPFAPSLPKGRQPGCAAGLRQAQPERGWLAQVLAASFCALRMVQA
jgi:preprotein translocase subunit SecF